MCKSCRSRQELSNEYLLFTCKIWRRYSRERASQNLPKIIQHLEKKLEKTEARAGPRRSARRTGPAAARCARRRGRPAGTARSRLGS